MHILFSQQFPKTNGSLYESLSLGREEASRIRARVNSAKRYNGISAPNSPRPEEDGNAGAAAVGAEYNGSFSSLPANASFYEGDSFDDPMSGGRNSATGER
jgi:hypothetical protein